ncbi:alpha-amylase family glycosyl hydrolase [Algoriphagus namhaensis]
MFRHLFLYLLSNALICTLAAQNYSEEERIQGHAQRGDTLIFVFDPEIYGTQTTRVQVTGAFRSWSTDMEEERWMLARDKNLWTLKLANANFQMIAPNTPFKYRINAGEWLNPPALAANQSGGNLIFLKEETHLKAEIRSENLIWARITKNRSLRAADYVITDASGNQTQVSQVLPHNATETLILPAQKLDPRRVYFLEMPDEGWKTHCSFDGWFRELYSDKPLGAEVREGRTDIRIFAPRADRVRLYLYQGREDQTAYLEKDLKVDENGVWEISFEEDLHGVYYDFTVHGSDDPGNHFYETNPVHINDPYARVSDDTWGKARIWRATKPASPLKEGIPKFEDVIAYEVHVQDFTDQLPLPDSLKGTFKGMITPGLKNSRGEKIGFDYLLDLGINVLHLMPVQEYLHFPTDDWKASFQDDPFMIYHGINEENYQWGYRTSFFMAIESRYRTKGTEPGTEREELRDLVQAFHDQGIAVIVDIVTNHTAENMTEREEYFNFNVLDKQYYYRTKNFEHIGEYGNEVKTENRPMVQRWLIDQCLYLINEIGIDGIRIDLAGQIDKQSLHALKAAIGEDKILYGEPWIASNDPDFENNPDWDWYKADAPITFFQDDARNAFKGPVFELKDKKQDRGWSGGNFEERGNVMRGLSASFPEDKTPLSGINYLDIHDNFALADQFAKEDFDGRYAVDQAEYKIAATLLYTSLGPIVTHGGSEIMRSKAHAPLEEVVKTTKKGYKNYFHGKRDTYNLRKANQFIWETVGQRPNEVNTNDYAGMLSFWRGLNRLRLSDYGRSFRVSEKVPEDYYRWILPRDKSMLGYIVNHEVLVFINAGAERNTFEQVEIPSGKWKLIGTIEEIDLDRGVTSDEGWSTIEGDQKMDFSLSPTSLLIYVKTKDE